VIERLLQQRIEALDLGGTTVASAGTHALVGEDMQPGSRKILLAHGADPDGFRSTSLDEVDLGAYDLVLTASESHRRAVIERQPSLFSRTFPLLAFPPVRAVSPQSPGTEAAATVVDPYRKGADHYHAMERQIVPAIDAVIAHLQQQR
jgi:protein-tyrosine phosphatase